MLTLCRYLVQEIFHYLNSKVPDPRRSVACVDQGPVRLMTTSNEQVNREWAKLPSILNQCSPTNFLFDSARKAWMMNERINKEIWAKSVRMFGRP